MVFPVLLIFPFFVLALLVALFVVLFITTIFLHKRNARLRSVGTAKIAVIFPTFVGILVEHFGHLIYGDGGFLRRFLAGTAT